MKFFFDNNASFRIAGAIKALIGAEGQHEAVHLTERFKADEKDRSWIPILRDEGGWVIISGDRFQKSERAVFKSARLTTFWYSKALLEAKMWDQAFRIVRSWPEIMKAASVMEPGSLFEIPYRVAGKFKPLN